MCVGIGLNVFYFRVCRVTTCLKLGPTCLGGEYFEHAGAPPVVVHPLKPLFFYHSRAQHEVFLFGPRRQWRAR